MYCGMQHPLSETILQTMSPAEIRGVDRSEGYVAFAREKICDERARFEVGFRSSPVHGRCEVCAASWWAPSWGCVSAKDDHVVDQR